MFPLDLNKMFLLLEQQRLQDFIGYRKGQSLLERSECLEKHLLSRAELLPFGLFQPWKLMEMEGGEGEGDGLPHQDRIFTIFPSSVDLCVAAG